MRDIKLNYEGIKKCVIADYPYPLDWDDTILYSQFEAVYERIIKEHSCIKNGYYSDNKGGFVHLNYMDHYIIMCHRFAYSLHKNGYDAIADAVFFSLRTRGGLDLFYTTEIGPFFMPIHPIGSVLDPHAKYGKLVKIYNGVHVGPYNIRNKKPEEFDRPIIGDYVTLLGHSHVYGKSVIGNNVILSVGTVVINETIPDNCIVMGQTPNLFFIPKKDSNSDILDEQLLFR